MNVMGISALIFPPSLLTKRRRRRLQTSDILVKNFQFEYKR